MTASMARRGAPVRDAAGLTGWRGQSWRLADWSGHNRLYSSRTRRNPRARFFFSSRRRHTRWNCDWSSDVCSSDLGHHLGLPAKLELITDDEDLWNDFVQQQTAIGRSLTAENRRVLLRHIQAWQLMELSRKYRSEERRVGKECRSRGVGGVDKKVEE